MKNSKSIFVAAVGVIAAFAVGILIGRGGGSHAGHDHAEHQHAPAAEAAKAEFHTCSMHPQIRLPDPNAKCPLCGMALIPVTNKSGGNDGPRDLTLSPGAQKLAGVRTAVVERKFVDAAIRMVGKVEYDETRLGYITAWVPGRLDRLYVDYTGVPVSEGDHMVHLYSPELLEAQQELIQALKTVEGLKNSEMTFSRKRAEATVASSREKLRLWGLSAEQIAKIEASEKPEDHITINAKMSGIVVHKNAEKGMYVQTGAKIYTIADLSKVWVKLDAYESDLAWLHYGQAVEFETEAYPGETFAGRISFLDPTLDSRTRTVKVRVNVDNSDGRLKPEMFVRAIVRSRVASGGKVMDPALAGKWISPMHPEIVKDEAGQCDICGMALVKAEELGYVSSGAGKEEAPLVIPASAPLLTGKRAVVYVEKSPGQYEGRVVELGPRAGDHYLVKSGLKEGEKVVTRGNFKIDSAVQILAKPSMMNPEKGRGARDEGRGEGHAHEHGGHAKPAPAESVEVTRLQTPEAFQAQLDAVYAEYLKLGKGLSSDDPAASRSAAGTLVQMLAKVDMTLLEGEAHEAWMKRLQPLEQAGQAAAEAGDMDAARRAFETVSNGMIAAVRRFGIAGDAKANVFHCPMAFGNKGASWLQSNDELENPYFGARMYRCGKLVEALKGRGAEDEGRGGGSDASRGVHKH